MAHTQQVNQGITTIRLLGMEALVFSQVVVLKRGDDAIPIPHRDMELFLQLVLRSCEKVLPPQTLQKYELKPPPSCKILPPTRGVSTEELWDSLRQYVQSCQRAQGEESIVRHLRRKYPDTDRRELRRRIRVLLRRKEVRVTRSERFTFRSRP